MGTIKYGRVAIPKKAENLRGTCKTRHTLPASILFSNSYSNFLGRLLCRIQPDQRRKSGPAISLRFGTNHRISNQAESHQLTSDVDDSLAEIASRNRHRRVEKSSRHIHPRCRSDSFVSSCSANLAWSLSYRPTRLVRGALSATVAPSVPKVEYSSESRRTVSGFRRV